MVFPIESEDRTLRSLLMLCQDHARLVLEAYRKTLIPFDTLVKGKEPGITDPLNEIHKIMNDANKVREVLVKQLNEVGGILGSRDDFLRLVSTFSDMLDTIEAITVRLIEVKSRNWKISKTQAESFGKISDLTFDSLVKLRDSIMSLGFNSEKAVGFAREIDDLEQKTDIIYIQLDLDIVTGGGELPAILILRDVARETERLVDKVREASNLVRIVAL